MYSPCPFETSVHYFYWQQLDPFFCTIIIGIYPSSILTLYSGESSLLDSLPTMQSAKAKRVSFESTRTRYFEQQSNSPSDDIKKRWYTNEELSDCREEAKRTLEALQAVQGKLELVDSRFCLRGIEKFADLMAKIRTQKLVKQSILQQQRQQVKRVSNDSGDENDDDDDESSTVQTTCPEQLAVLSRYLSQPSRDIAHQYALLNAREAWKEDSDTEDLASSAADTRSPMVTPSKDTLPHDENTCTPIWISPVPPPPPSTLCSFPPSCPIKSHSTSPPPPTILPTELSSKTPRRLRTEDDAGEPIGRPTKRSCVLYSSQ